MSRATKKVLVILSLILISTVSFLPHFDMYGKEQNEKILKSSMITYASARGVNAAISVIQETQVGAGMVFQPGQVLDPLNDLIERFSSVLLFSMASLGIQNIMIYLGSSLIIKSMILVSSLSLVLLLLLPNMKTLDLHTVLIKLLIVGLFLRFSIPTITILNQFMYSAFMEHKVTEAVEGLNQEEESSTTNESESWWDSLVGSVSAVSDDISNFMGNIEAITRRVIDLISIFIIQTILMPSLFLLFIIKYGKKSLKGSSKIAEQIFIDT
jgi:hypothetical protein